MLKRLRGDVAVRAGMWAFSGNFCQQLAQFAVALTLARILSPEAFGLVALAQLIIWLSEAISKFGFGTGLIALKDINERAERTAATLMLLAGTAISIAVYLIIPNIASVWGAPELTQLAPIIVLSIMLSAGMNASRSVLMREMKFRQLARIDVPAWIVGYACTAVALALYGMSFWSILLANLIRLGIQFVCVTYEKPLIPTIHMKKDEVLRLIRFGWVVFATEIVNIISLRGNSVVISTTLGLAAVGNFGRAYVIADLGNTAVGRVFYNVLLPNVASMRKAGTHDTEVAQRYIDAQRAAALILLPISGLFYLSSRDVVFVVLGPKWLDISSIFSILTLGMFFRLSYKTSAAFLVAYEKVYLNLAIQIAFGAMTISGAYFFSGWGLDGIALAFLCAVVVTAIFYGVVVGRILRPQWLELIRTVSFISLAVIFSVAAVWMFGVHNPDGQFHVGKSIAIVGLYSAILTTLLSIGYWTSNNLVSWPK